MDVNRTWLEGSLRHVIRTLNRQTYESGNSGVALYAYYTLLSSGECEAHLHLPHEAFVQWFMARVLELMYPGHRTGFVKRGRDYDDDDDDDEHNAHRSHAMSF